MSSGEGAQGAAGMGQNIDWTFGQKGVYDDKTSRTMELLKALIMGSSKGAQITNNASNPGQTQVAGWDPQMIARLMSFGGGA